MRPSAISAVAAARTYPSLSTVSFTSKRALVGIGVRNNRVWFGHQRENQGFCLGIGPFADMFVADVAVFVDQIAGGPEALLIGPPGLAIVVDGDRIFDAEPDGGIADVVDVFFVRKFWIMDANDGKVIAVVFVVPFPDPGNYMLAVNSTKGPEFNQDHLSPQGGQGQGRFGV
jgi:hypothetical protein